MDHNPDVGLLAHSLDRVGWELISLTFDPCKCLGRIKINRPGKKPMEAEFWLRDIDNGDVESARSCIALSFSEALWSFAEFI
jgi:hypothetical protein